MSRKNVDGPTQHRPEIDYGPNQEMDAGERERYSRAVVEPGDDFVPDPEVRESMGFDSIHAKFKIEILFGPRRSTAGPNGYMMQLYESGKRLHGGGDELSYWCKDVRDGHDDGCWGVIIGDWIKGGVAYCPNCEAMIAADHLTCQRGGNVTTVALAEHLAAVWRNLGCNADIYCKYNPDDIRYKVTVQQVGALEARKLRGLFIYPLKHILKDTVNGASLEGRFKAFLSA